ncbi:PD-(D/E)XK nuclease family protein [Tychonema sp. LEGE 07203]|uniref:PD-(D/E)XK nuclease family protein n=1 Tax=Tychonema sp. LEGE 07203 TaxID=1828671 RepID=UPI00187DFB5F|nr:PD-(D/E)XK nuclease family protein [Tychonema sp. LEGE 07203]MBE9097042.1 PD-(D/E)XK nuclease family protein [Tychonema sp. LEGE 07203]
MLVALFSRLLNLNTGSIPLEDFFTELVAYLFSTDKEILYSWLKNLNLLDINIYLDAYVSTQREFEPLDDHRLASRPDILIELVDAKSRSIIFIESKIGSQEGYEQLSRYAEILHGISGFQHKFLLYITRDFDPKDKADIFKNISQSTVQFRQLRWHQFYRFLKSQADTMLVKEIVTFMDEYRMAHNNQFSSIDVIALANFTKSLKLMEETMWGEVSQRFEKVLGAIKQKSTALTQIQWHGRYLMTASMPSGRWWCGLGFILKTSHLTDYPIVRLVLEVDPNSPRRAEIIETMKDICEQYGWRGYNLDSSKDWAGIVRDKSLQDFLSEEDHVVAVKRFFLQALDELEKIKDQYSKLPWVAIQGNGESSDDTRVSSSNLV